MATAKKETVEKIKCSIHSLDKDEKSMTFGYNGVITQVKLGDEVELTKDQIRVIKDAVMVKHIAETDAKGQPTGKTKLVKEPRYIVEAAV